MLLSLIMLFIFIVHRSQIRTGLVTAILFGFIYRFHLRPFFYFNVISTFDNHLNTFDSKLSTFFFLFQNQIWSDTISKKNLSRILTQPQSYLLCDFNDLNSANTFKKLQTN